MLNQPSLFQLTGMLFHARVQCWGAAGHLTQAVQSFASATPCSLLFPQEGKCEPSSAHSPGQESSWSIPLKQSLSSPLFLSKPEKRTKTLSLSFGNLLIGSPVKLQRLSCLIMIVNDRDYQVYLVMSLGSLQLV